MSIIFQRITGYKNKDISVRCKKYVLTIIAEFHIFRTLLSIVRILEIYGYTGKTQ